MTTIAEREEAVVEEFSFLEDWMQRYAHLIDLGRSLPEIEEEYRTDEYRVHGCQSQVWLRCRGEAGRVYYRADSDAAITKGLIALLVRVLDGQPAIEVAQARLDFIDRIGMREHLSPTRSNGLNAMVQRMKRCALAALAGDPAPADVRGEAPGNES